MRAFVGIVLGVTGAALIPSQEATYVKEAQGAVKRSIPLLQKSGQTWLDRSSCTSCHHQSLGFIALQISKDNGFRVDQGALDKQLLESNERRATTTHAAFELTGAINGVSGHGYTLLSQATLQTPASDFTDAAGFYLTAKQLEDGRWVSTSHRPPMEDSSFTVTATSLRALKVYPPRTGGATAIANGRKWLMGATPTHSEGRAMKLLGLIWSDAPKAEIEKARQSIIAHQQADGGWAQTDGRKSDAYATGQAIVALGVSRRISRSDKVIARGVRYLVSTQKPDGSWLVPTRRVVEGLPYFETGFPHGIHQFISYAGTAWATAALAAYASNGNLESLRATAPLKRVTVPSRMATNPSDEAVLRSAWVGSVDELRRALQKGGNPNARTSWGTSALMIAVRDAKKVGVLLRSGANPNLQSKLGATALSLASGTNGALPSMKLLLAAQADPNKGKKMETPLSHALLFRDNERVKALLSAGAKMEPLSLLMAYTVENLEGMELLIKSGFDPNIENPLYGGNAVNDAVIDRNPRVLEFLLSRGVNPNVIDKEGFSALQVAALGDPGDWKLVKMLLEAGAEKRYRTAKRGTPFELALKRGNKESAKILAED